MRVQLRIHTKSDVLNQSVYQYSQLSPNGHSRKRTALLTDTVFNSPFYRFPSFYVGNNSRKRTALLTGTFSNSRGCPLMRELTVILYFHVPVFQVQEFVLLLSPVFQKAPGVPHQTLVHSFETQNKNHKMEKF